MVCIACDSSIKSSVGCSGTACDACGACLAYSLAFSMGAILLISSGTASYPVPVSSLATMSFLKETSFDGFIENFIVFDLA